MWTFNRDTNTAEDLLLCVLQQDEYLLDVCLAAFGYDSMNSSRPICSPAETPTQIAQMFDTISYEKVCKMILSVQILHVNLWSFLIFLHHTAIIDAAAANATLTFFPDKQLLKFPDL